MGLNKGQTNNPKGRPKGVPNRATADIKGWVQKLIDDNRTVFEADLKKLEPAQRLTILERLMQYVVPKQQAIDITAQIEAEYAELGKLLEQAPDEVIERLTIKIQTLNQLSNQNE